MADSVGPVWRDSAAEEQTELKRKITEMDKKKFLRFCEARKASGGPIYEMFLALGFLEAVDDEAIRLVYTFVINQIKAELKAAVEDFGGGDLKDLSFCDFTEVLEEALENVSGRLLVAGTKSIECIVAEFAEFDVSWVRIIARAFVEAVFTRVTRIVTMRPLRKRSFEDIRDLFEVAIPFGHRLETVAIDRGFLETKIVNHWLCLIDCFTKEYCARLDRALKAEEWQWVTAEWIYIEIVRELSGSKTTSFELNGGRYAACPPVLILLEFIYEYLEMAQTMKLLISDLTRILFRGIRFFVSGSSKELLQRKCPATLPTLALSASGLHFYFHLVPLVKSKLVSANAPLDLVEQVSSDAITELKQSYDEVVKRIESMCMSPAKAESDGAGLDVDPESKKSTEITDEVRTIDWLRSLVRDSILARTRSEVVDARDGSKEKTGSNGIGLIDSGSSLYEKGGGP
jgi:hypothetical protein